MDDFLNINDDILLIGEANFSFTISLAEHCLNRGLITATCYESLSDLKAIFGENEIEKNLSLLKTLNVNKVLFNVDACKLSENSELMSRKFSRIVFMFPHACCKKTNLKLNRQLLERFLVSSRFLLKFNGCVYVTLARGQGGTRFDVNLNPKSEKANDNWQLVPIANKCGYLLTDCFSFNAGLFQYYTSTGYKVQNKSFHIEKALVHKLELSLSVDSEENYCLSGALIALNGLVREKFMLNDARGSSLLSSSPFINEYLNKTLALHRDKGAHVLNSLKLSVFDKIKARFNGNVKLYDNYLSCHFTSTHGTDYAIECFDKLAVLSDPVSKSAPKAMYFIRNKLKSDDLLNELDGECLNVCSALLLDTAGIAQNNELNNYRYEILFYMKSENIPIELKSAVVSALTESANLQHLMNIEEAESSTIYLVDSEPLFQVTLTRNEFACELNAGFLCLLANKLNDKRLLYTDDMRNFRQSCIKPLLIQPESYTHDLCFWYNRNEFDEKKFLNLIRDLTHNQVRQVVLIDKNFKKVNLKYKNEYDGNEDIYSAFYRFVYETYDKAMDFDTARYIQDSIRDQIKLKLNLVPR